MNAPNVEPASVALVAKVSQERVMPEHLAFAQIAEESIETKSKEFLSIFKKEFSRPQTNNTWLYVALALKAFQPDEYCWEFVYEEILKLEIAPGYIKRIGSSIETSFDEVIGILWILSQGPRTELRDSLLNRVVNRLEISDGVYSLKNEKELEFDFSTDLYRMIDMRPLVRSAGGLRVTNKLDLAWAISAFWKTIRLPGGASHWLRLWLQSDIMRGHSFSDMAIWFWKKRMAAAEITLYSCLISEPREIPQIAETVFNTRQNW